ncbi:inositol 1,4,5-triphosphate receptor associated 2 [Varanus komodoensis]|uniref:inositol 1,4,5-triphosphate receptor associated 2 n=1 Tax=Varanus komodoensis TaxID=61221 RepID=UPI001CF7E506|nr:inositol 1,4,5-triphosphate receptor associated 2 [Varanus komodoensis]
MSSNRGRGKRHHHPVNSLCRKLQTIKMMDQASNPALQIPKFQSKNFDSPQGNMKKNLEEIWKRRTLKTSDNSTVPSSDGHSLSPLSDNVFSPCSPVATPSHRRISDIRSETFSVGRNKEKACRPWLDQAESCSPCLLDWGELGSNPPYGSTGRRLLTEAKDDESDEVSLICEEDLLTTMFSACDVERRGKVAVSKLVDFLRFTTSRSSEDSQLEELCNMLDPEQRDISMDLETYHAIMKEWIEDCRRNWHEPSTWDTTREGTQAAKRTPGRMNVTSGSLEALGGDVSRGDLETSDLIACIADLQFNNQKLQEENGQLKLALDTMEEANNRLTEEGGELRNQIKSFQQSVAQVKTLQRELEESKNNLGAAEEKGLKMASQTKQLEKENQSLIFKISSLQEENIRTALDADGFQKKIAELSRNMAELQMQVHLYENMVGNKDTSLLQKDMDVQELKSTLKEYTSVIETLRAEKNKLVKNVQRMQQELISNGINFPLMHKLNSSNLEATNSLHCELELAEEQLEVGNDIHKFPSTEWSLLDESMDREVLLLLQEPERVGERFKAAIQNLQELFHLDELSGLSLLQGSDAEANGQEAYEKRLGALRQDLEARRTLWLQKLELLEAQKESLDKGLVKMVVQLRKMRTEQLHLKKALSSRQCELASVTKLKEDAEGEADILRSALQEARNQLEEALKRVEDQEGHFQASCEEAHSLQKELRDSIAAQERLQGINLRLTQTCQLLEWKVKEQSTDLGSLREKSFIGPLGRTLYQSCADADGRPLSSLNVNEETRTEDKESSCNQRFEVPQHWPFRSSWSPVLRCCFSQYSSQLDALALDSLLLGRRSSALRTLKNTGQSSAFEEPHLRNGSILDVMLEEDRCKSCSAGNQTDAGFPSGTRMDADFAKGDVQPLTDVLPSSDSIPSQEVSSLAPECTKGSYADKDPTLLHAMEDHARQAASLPAEETAATARQAEMETSRSTAAGDCSTEGLPSVAVCRNRQKGSVSPSEKEVEAEFLRLSLGFKCDLFTLEKRVRLEERSRDLAEGNLRKEIASSLKLLDSLASLSDDNQVQEIAKKLQKSLELLNQHATRIASKAEMLGAIHQESRVSKAVEVMIQHVENLKRTYAREHAELEELKEVLLQNRRSFSSVGDRDEAAIKKLSGSLKGQLNETDGGQRNDKFSRRPSWALLGAKQGEKPPLLQRYVSYSSWTESEEDQAEAENSSFDLPPPDQGSKTQKLSEKESSPSKWRLLSLCTRAFSWTSHARTSFCQASKALYVSVVAVVLLAVLLAFLLGVPFQRSAEAAPLGTGDAWTSVQQLLWPYTGLHHQGPPPV